jgi:hypothetical protein
MLAGLQARNIRLTRPKAPGQFSLRQAVPYPVLGHPDRDVVGSARPLELAPVLWILHVIRADFPGCLQF